ncbi:hypothetical protein B0J14DRAFT_487481 [Halenospora varia]|nr:hypothetical protein B0J14DRAFT_487481 [Halenospora varia]
MKGRPERRWPKTTSFIGRFRTLTRGLKDRKALGKRVLIGLLVAVIITVLSICIWYVLLAALVVRLSPPPPPSNGIQQIVKQWKEPGTASPPPPLWLENFTRDLVPIACHSHNDYWRNVPLFDALSVGCSSVEADIWITDSSGELYVGHSQRSLRNHRTLKSLYLDPLFTILQNQNSAPSVNTTSLNTTLPVQGIFDTSPNTTLVLLLDFKTDGASLFPLVEKHLQPLREKGWLTHFNGTAVIPGPITIVGSGNTPFDSIIANSTYRDIFFDAPLESLATETKYTTENSYYASVALKKAVGYIWFNKFSSKQTEIIQKQIQVASGRGLVSRYWDLPAWPVSWRTSVWRMMTDNGVGVLNVDDLAGAARWNWRACSVMGLNLC